MDLQRKNIQKKMKSNKNASLAATAGNLCEIFSENAQAVETVAESFIERETREINELKKKINQALESYNVEATIVNILQKILCKINV